MKLVVLITGLDVGGAEIMLLKVLGRLAPRFEPHVISLTNCGAIGARIRALGVPVEALGLSASVPNPWALVRLVSRLRALKPSIVHTWMYHADLLGGLAARLAGCAAVGWGIRNHNLDTGATQALTRWVVRACAWTSHWVPHRILCCSEVSRRFHVSIGYAPGKMVVVPNGFDLHRFQPDAAARAELRQEWGVPSDALVVGLVGRFDPQKNHAGFVKAAAALHARVPRVQFVLAGGGVDSSNRDLVRWIGDAGLAPVTHLLGLRDDVASLMAAIDVLASASHSEAFPNVLGEAMACGIPCVATDAGDSADILGDTGCVVPVGDMTALALAMETLLHLSLQDRQALGARGRSRIAANFELDTVVARYEAFYDDLAGLNFVSKRPGKPA